MLLKSLRLRGFKSFADRTDFPVTPGITCIVGPNGSGKSNVVEALMWVMGAQAARRMRGASMEDVIFMGSPQRQQLGRAEVELVIDNSSGAIAVDVPEIAIGRVLFRSGESRYTINGENCRLVDVIELLSDAGVGRTMHNVVSQGRIDAVLLASPEERRVVIEEAAGVLKHRRRRERALRRLEAVDVDLVRLEDVERELMRLLRPLERQVKGAQRHQELSAELHAVRQWVAGDQIRRRRAALGEANAEVERCRAEQAGLAERRRSAAAERSANEARAGDVAGSVEAARAHADRLDRLSMRLQGLANLAAERRRGLNRQQATLDAPLDGVDDLDTQREAIRGDLAKLATAEADLDETSRSHETDLLAHEAELTDVDAAWRAAGLDGDERRAALAAQRATVAAALSRAEAELQRLGDRRDPLAARLGAVEDERTAVSEESGRLAAGATSLAERVATVQSLCAAADTEVASLVAAHRRDEGEAASLLARASSIEAAAAGDAAAAQSLDEVVARFGALPRLHELVSVEPGAESAVAAAIGPLLGAVVLPDGVSADAVAVVKGVERGELVLAEAVPANSADVPGQVDAAGLGAVPVSSLVNAAPGAHQQPVASVLAHHLGRAVLARNADAGLRLSRERPDLVVVTQDGDRFEAGLLVARARRSDGVEAVPMLEAGEARRRADAARGRAASAAKRLSACEDDVARLRSEERDALRASADAQATAAALVDRLGRLETEAQTVTRELARLDEAITSITASLASDRTRLHELDATLAAEAPTATEGERRGLEDRRSRLEARGAQLRTESLRIEGERARIAERRRQHEHRLGELDRLEDAAVERAARAAHEGRAIASALGALEAAAVVLSEASEEAARRHRHAAGVLEAARAERAAVLRRLDLSRTVLAEVTAAEGAAADALHRGELAAAEARLRAEAAEEVPGREFGLPVDTCLAAGRPETVASMEPAEIDAYVDALVREQRRLGPVNPLAVEECEELRGRRDTLERELDDVRGAKRELVKVVAQVDERIAGILASAYEDVGRHFADLFALLFPGGEGRLVLTDPSDPLGTGVDVEARPSGKTAKRLSLLSGGERSLSALAFLFAVFRARPSPFYVLDEVEAALDDLNLHRFCNLLRDFRRDSQLVVVTHQRRTMETADVLYGISLSPDGTSQAISQRIGDLDLEVMAELA